MPAIKQKKRKEENENERRKKGMYNVFGKEKRKLFYRDWVVKRNLFIFYQNKENDVGGNSNDEQNYKCTAVV